MLPSIDAQADIAIEQTQKLLYPHLQCRKMLLSFLRTGFSQDSVLPQLVVLELLQWAGRCGLRELQMQRGAERLCRRWCRNWYGKPLHGTFNSVSVVRSGRNLQVSCGYGIVTMYDLWCPSQGFIVVEGHQVMSLENVTHQSLFSFLKWKWHSPRNHANTHKWHTTLVMQKRDCGCSPFTNIFFRWQWFIPQPIAQAVMNIKHLYFFSVTQCTITQMHFCVIAGRYSVFMIQHLNLHSNMNT